jgi:hypothetical protein
LVSKTHGMPDLSSAPAVIPDPIVTLIAPPERSMPRARPDSRRTYVCPGCGHVLRVFGLGRHRVYFESDDDSSDHPIISRVCSDCGRGLPGKNPPGIL